jgi:CRISPR-associated protein Csb2
MPNLALEIEYLGGVAFAAQGPDKATPDWPPQPDRVFSALVATWGARGEQKSEAEALRWLEEQPLPILVASESEPRTAPRVYVPPNDFGTSRGPGIPKPGSKAFRQAASVIPSWRDRKERTFPASRPHDPIVRYYWKSVPDTLTFQALKQLAADTAYVGHSSSLTRCRFLQCDGVPEQPSQSPRRRVYPGRFEELHKAYQRFARSNGMTGRPRPGDPVISRRVQTANAARSCFSLEWLVLEHVDGEMPDIRASALVAKEIRDALLSGYDQCGIGDEIPAEVSGHLKDGSPSSDPHIAIIPLVFAGFPYADGHLLGFALVPPRSSGVLKDSAFRGALRKIAPRDEESGRRNLRLRFFELQLSPTLTPSRKSLDPSRYTRPSRLWATVTPIALDRHLKKVGAERQKEIDDQIQAACRNIGLPKPDKIRTDKHPAVEGVPSAYPSGKAPSWMRWRLPASLASRQLTHAVIRFAEPVAGPVILGAGRFVGLGLCLPLDEEEAEA